MPIDFDDVPGAFNLVEAVWWMAVALIVGTGRLGVAELHGWPKRLLVVAFFLFGVSDLIEFRTGAWWRPASLLMLKVACIAAFIAGVVAVAIRQKAVRMRSDSNENCSAAPSNAVEKSSL